MQLDMVCTCDIDGVREVEERRLRIFRRMGLDAMEELTTAIILSLAFDFQADVDVYADQWFGVRLKTPLASEYIYVECDHPGDGLAVIWEHLVGAFPDRVPAQSNPTTTRIAERVSGFLLGQYESATNNFDKHQEDAGHNGINFATCEDCMVFFAISSMADRSLDEAWGSRVLEPTIEKAF